MTWCRWWKREIEPPLSNQRRFVRGGEPSTRGLEKGCWAPTDLVFLAMHVYCTPTTTSPACSPSQPPPSLSFDLSSSVSLGAAKREEHQSRCKDRTGARCSGGTWQYPGVRLRGDGTHTGVCDKRMSFTANDSRRGDQLPVLQLLTHVPAIPTRIDSTEKHRGEKSTVGTINSVVGCQEGGKQPRKCSDSAKDYWFFLLFSATVLVGPLHWPHWISMMLAQPSSSTFWLLSKWLQFLTVAENFIINIDTAWPAGRFFRLHLL